MLVYTITLKSSFDELTPIRAQVMRAREEVPVSGVWFVANVQCPMIVVGNKCDLVDLREVPEQDAIDFADKFDALRIESSAKAKINIEEIFVTLVREIVKRNTVAEAAPEVVEEEPVKAGCCAVL